MNNQPMPIQSQMQPDNQIIDNQPPEIEEQQQEQDIISQNISNINLIILKFKTYNNQIK